MKLLRLLRRRRLAYALLDEYDAGLSFDADRWLRAVARIRASLDSRQ